MQSLLPVIVSLIFLFLTSCSCENSFWKFTCGIPKFFGERLDDGERYDVPLASYVDLPPPQISIHAEEITAIIQDYSVELKNLKRLHLRHALTYYNDAGIHTIQLQYISQDIIELCQARKLIIDVTEGFLEQLNSDSILIPEFPDHAFYPFNFEIYIDFESYFRFVDPFYVKWIVLEDGVITFYTGDVVDNEKKGWHAKKESYETSRNIVFYERLAEDKYKAMHEVNRAIFGDKRYWPTYHIPPKVLE